MNRLAIIVVTALLVATSVLLFHLVTEPKKIDVGDCDTRWRDGRIVSVTCPGGVPG